MDELTARDVIAAIRWVLSGQMTQPELGQRAHRALLNDDTGVRPIIWRYRPEISRILMPLMALDEGLESEASTAELDSIIESLLQLDYD